MRVFGPWSLVSLLLLSLPVWAQPTIRVDVQLVNMGFSVRDAHGKLVSDLTQDDVEVSEDGVAQKVAFFARSTEVPLSLGLVVDISGSQDAFLRQHHRDLRAFLDTVLTPRDRAFLVCFANRPRLVTEYTASAKKLVDALSGYEGVRDKTSYPLLGPLEIPTGGSVFYDALYHSARQMFTTEERGRRAIIVFSDGEDNASAHHMMDAIEAAQQNDILLFPIRYSEIRNGRPNSRNKYGASVMTRIAQESGGADFDASEHDLSAHFKEIGEQLRQSYELAYHSSVPQGDGSFHKVRISSRRPNLTVRAKTGYYSR